MEDSQKSQLFMMSNFSSLPTFHPFSKLPPEIRLQIWRTALENSQCLELRCRKYTISGNKFDYHWHWYSLSPIPVLLHVCYESRVEALKAYQSHFLNINHHISLRTSIRQTRLISHKGNEHNTGMIYLNLDRDTVIIHFPSANESTNQFNISTANLACADLIQNLGISSHQVAVETLLDIYGMQLFLSPFRNIKRIFQMEITSKENQEQEMRILTHIPGIYSTTFLNTWNEGEREGIKMAEIGMNFPKSCRFWFHALVRKALENLREGGAVGVVNVTVLGSEEVREGGGLRPWYCFVGRIPLNSNRLLV